MAELSCRHFGGYKPCARSQTCSAACAHFAPVGPRVLLVHLGALGAVVRSTSLIAAVRRRYPDCVITWVTRAPAHALLTGVVDRVLTTSADDLLTLSALEFDVALVVDKEAAATGVVRRAARVNQVRGFIADRLNGASTPATEAARELWNLGLSNHDKFFVNLKTEQHLTHEALELGPFARDDYRLHLQPTETAAAEARRRQWGGRLVLGLNTGCSPTLPAKKLSVEGHRDLIAQILADPRFAGVRIVLLGGPEDHERNRAIAAGLPVVESPTVAGLRDGLVSVAACDLVFTGDSLGMHLSIAMKKWVVAWFGPSCAHEIDLYGRGVKIMTKAACAPCWKRSCGEVRMCYDQVDFFDVVEALAKGLPWLTSSSKPLSPETCSSPSP